MALACTLVGPALAHAADPATAPLSDLKKDLWATPTATTSGMGITSVQGVAGAQGQNTRLYHLDHRMTPLLLAHNEFVGKPFTLLPGADQGEGGDHGMGQGSVMYGRNVGIVPGVPSIIFGEDPQPPEGIDPDHIGVAFRTVTPKFGDVMLLEAVANHVNSAGTGVWGPWESFGVLRGRTPAVNTWDQIRAATDLGVTVVEPGANDAANLDDVVQSANMRNADGTPRDSGGIIVGAGAVKQTYCSDAGNARSRLGYSVYGARVDVQGPGNCYPGAGNGFRGSLATHDNYAWDSGTSGASAIVAGVTTSLASLYRGQSGSPIATPDALRNALRRTATAQTADEAGDTSKKIGGLVNLQAAFDYLKAAPQTPASSGPTSTALRRPTFTAGPATSGISYECRIVPNPLPTYEALLGHPLQAFHACPGATTETPTADLAPGGWKFEARAKTTAGNFDASPSALAFTVVPSTLVTSSGGVITATLPDRDSSVLAKVNGSNYEITDTDAVRVGAGCTLVTAFKASCPTSGVTTVKLNGGTGSDTILATIPVVAALSGGAGNDTLISTGAGKDTFSGGAGADTVDYTGVGTTPVKASLDGVANDGTSTTSPDNIASDVEGVWTGNGADTLVGTSTGVTPTAFRAGGGNDTITAGSGSAGISVDPGPGNDTITGGAANDTVDYRNSTNALTITNPGTAVGTAEGTDTLGASVDTVLGGSGADVFKDGTGTQRFWGYGGNDTFTLTTNGGNDRVDGGDGLDTVKVLPNAGADQVDLGTLGGTDTVDFSALTSEVSTVVTTANGVQVTTATATGISTAITGMNKLVGSPFDDYLWADDSGVIVNGGSGADVLQGGSGVDVLTGGAGKDLYAAGAGDDYINADDGVAEKVDCGVGQDTANVDGPTSATPDVLTACEG